MMTVVINMVRVCKERREVFDSRCIEFVLSHEQFLLKER
jgi:hypothetical protein